MQIVGHGIDIVDTSRVARLLDQHERRFLLRCFTEHEQACAADRRHRLEFLAGRFAAKEAIMKAVGTGWRNGIAWTDAEVVREASGRPIVRLHGQLADIAAERGIDQWWISISHIRTHATASAIAVATG